MIARISGTLVEKDAGRLVVDVGGVGYDIHAASSTFFRIPEPGSEIVLHIRTIVKEDSITLYGFDEIRERNLFDMLISVTKIGPKMALGILSGMAFDELLRSIADSDIRTLTKISGLGKKTAERLVVELKDKVTKFARCIEVDLLAESMPGAARDAVSALMNLDYSRVEAERSVSSAMRDLSADAELEPILTAALKILGKVS